MVAYILANMCFSRFYPREQIILYPHPSRPGENLALGTSVRDNSQIAHFIDLWTKEHDGIAPGDFSCFSGNQHTCGHYTQVGQGRDWHPGFSEFSVCLKIA